MPISNQRRSRRKLLGGFTGAGLALLTHGPRRAHAEEPRATPVAAASRAEREQSAAANATPGASGRATPTVAPRSGGELRLLRPGGSLENFNPSAFAQDPQVPLSYLEPLVRPDPTSMAPVPWLSEGWEWGADGRELTFRLRAGVRWQDGQRLTADDARFSFEVYRDDVDSAVSGLFELVASVEALSEQDLVVRFAERDGGWLFNAASLPIFSQSQYREFWEATPEGARSLSGFDWSKARPIGTGPWRVDDWDAHRVGFSRFDGYWGAAALLDRLEVRVAEGIQRRVDAWESGEAQILWPAPSRRDREDKVDSEAITAVPAASVMFAAFNFANPNQPNGSLWGDVRVRQAASLAIDRERYGDEVFGGRLQARAAGTVAQPWARDASIQTPELNREAAAVLLGEAGWLDYDGDGFREDANGVPLQPVAIVRDDMPPYLIAVLARVARDLAEAGFNMSVEVLPADTFDRRWIEQHDYDLIAYAYDLLPGFTDYDLYGTAWDIRSNPAGWNPGGYSNPDADAAIADYLRAVSVTRQREALFQLQRAVDDDLFGLWLGFPDDVLLIARDVKGFEPDMAWQTAQTPKLWISEPAS